MKAIKHVAVDCVGETIATGHADEPLHKGDRLIHWEQRRIDFT